MVHTQGSIVRQRKDSAIAAQFAFDIVGIGALNLDYLVSSPGGLLPIIAGIAKSHGEGFQPEGKTTVAAQTIAAALAATSGHHPVAELGGAAFNTVTAAAHTGLRLRLGYVGVAGHSPIARLNSVARLTELGIDTRMVRREPGRTCGVCVAVTEHGERTILAHPGANDQLAEYLRADSAAIVNYLASANVIHVSALRHAQTPKQLLAVLRAVKARSPATRISLDPSQLWSADPRPEVAGLISLADYLLVNEPEFRLLANGAAGAAEDYLLHQRAKPGAVLIIKRPNGIWWHQSVGGQLMTASYTQKPIPATDIRDATGAGDIFAAGLLAVLIKDRQALPEAARTGLRLARHSLRHTGTAGHRDFRVLLQHPAGW